MWLLDQIAEARISEAAERGELDDLPGEREPLVLDDDSMVPESLRPGYRLLKNAGFVPPELEPHRALREVEDLIEQLSEQSAERSAAERRARVLLNRLGQSGRDQPLQVEEGYYRKLVDRFRKPGDGGIDGCA